MSKADKYFLIWSNEHNAWWAPGSRGYTPDVSQAGIYGEKQAYEIVQNANRYQYAPDPPNECLVPTKLSHGTLVEPTVPFAEFSEKRHVILDDAVVALNDTTFVVFGVFKEIVLAILKLHRYEHFFISKENEHEQRTAGSPTVSEPKPPSGNRCDDRGDTDHGSGVN